MDFISISLIFTVYTTFVPVVVTIHSNDMNLFSVKERSKNELDIDSLDGVIVRQMSQTKI